MELVLHLIQRYHPKLSCKPISKKEAFVLWVIFRIILEHYKNSRYADCVLTNHYCLCNCSRCYYIYVLVDSGQQKSMHFQKKRKYFLHMKKILNWQFPQSTDTVHHSLSNLALQTIAHCKWLSIFFRYPTKFCKLLNKPISMTYYFLLATYRLSHSYSSLRSGIICAHNLPDPQ